MIKSSAIGVGLSLSSCASCVMRSLYLLGLYELFLNVIECCWQLDELYEKTLIIKIDNSSGMAK